MTESKRKKAQVVALTGPQHTAVIALAAGQLKREAAEKAGVRPATVSAWLARPDFQAALDSLRNELVSNAALQLRAMTATAISALRETLETGPAPARLRAAMYVLDRLAASQPVRDEIQPDPGSDVSTEKILQAIGFSQ